MNSKIIIAIIVSLMSFTLSCFSDSKIVSKFISKNLRIKFYHSYPDREISPLLFAQVDSGKSRYTYYFKSNKIYKLDQNEKNYVYTLSFTVPDIQFSSNSYFSHISQLDLLVFKSIPSTNPIIFYPSMLHNFAVAIVRCCLFFGR
jgi:hypothetical protein